MRESAIDPKCIVAYAAPKPRAVGRIPRLLLLSAWAYPLLLVAGFYGTWVIAWLVLGHPPRPSLDDPKSISAVVDVPYVATALLLLIMPLALLYGVVVGTVITTWWVYARGGGV